MSRQGEDFIILNKAKDLYVYTSEAINNTKIIPKSRRYPVGQRLEALALDIYIGVSKANHKNIQLDFKARQDCKDDILANCETMKSLINALKASKAYPGVDVNKAEVWTRFVLDVYYMVRAWRDNEQEKQL